ncbi:MAG: hypothetical protein R3C29_04000 [Dehalococcoidia bacterium]
MRRAIYAGQKTILMPTRVESLAASFWSKSGVPETLPRDIESAAIWTLPVGVFRLPQLTVNLVTRWLASRGLPVMDLGPDRPLHACLLAHRGYGLIMLDGADAPGEQRISIAHEVAHFLSDYWIPRSAITGSLGTWATEIVDGTRIATTTERIGWILSMAPTAPRAHLMGRGADGSVACNGVATSEFNADQLAFELLAPRQMVLANVSNGDREQLVSVLSESYGLPKWASREYATQLALWSKELPSFREWLGIRK